MNESTALPGAESVTEKFSNALRSEHLKSFSHSTSPLAGCLLPLLQELGWHNYARELIEALPHFSTDLDIVDLRNILVTLGYESNKLETRLQNIKTDYLPCLFISDKGKVFLLQEKQGKEFKYFNPITETNEYEKLPNLKGAAYVFTDQMTSHGITERDIKNEGWFSNLVQRFKGMLFHLLAMTALINVIALAIPLSVMVIYDKVIGSRSIDTLPYLLGGISIVLIADLLIRILRARLLGNMAGRMDYLIGVETFKQIISLPPIFTEKSTMISQLSRLKQFDSVRDFFTGQNAALVLELPFVVLSLGVIALLAGWIAIIPLVMIVIYTIIGLIWIPDLARKTMRAGIAKTNKQRMLMQSLTGRHEIKSIGGETVWQERFRESSGEAVMANYKTYLSIGIVHNVAQALMTISGVAVIGFGAQGVMDGSISMGALIAIMSLVWRVLSPLQTSFLSYSKLQQTWRSIKQIDQLMRLKTEKKSGHAGLMLDNLKGSIKLDRISFRYGPEDNPALLGVSFSVEPGESIAICGDTGSGKSTILKVISGMYKPQGGTLSIDDLDIRQLNALDLRRAIAYVPQETRMFHGSITQNLRLNNVLATDDELRIAAENAGILDAIDALPEGFETRIGDSITDQFPPGFKRSLSMARAFVSPAQIVLFDEPGASLDDESDQQFMNQLQVLRKKKTILMVTHRPSHIRLTDKAIYLLNGSIAFAGTPDEVIKLMLEQTK